jgi:hypothetical protein
MRRVLQNDGPLPATNPEVVRIGGKLKGKQSQRSAKDAVLMVCGYVVWH